MQSSNSSDIDGQKTIFFTFYQKEIVLSLDSLKYTGECVSKSRLPFANTIHMALFMKINTPKS